jgi:FkbM family methyltransferase
MFALKNEHSTGHKTLQVRNSSRGAVMIRLPGLHGMRPPPPPSPPYPPPPPCERLNSPGPRAVMRLASDLQNLQLIQIGANVGDFAPMLRTAGRSDVGCTDLGATVAADLLRSPNVKGLLVEASPSNFKQLQQNLQSSGLSKRHSAVNAAVCTASKEMTFYSVAEDFADKYPDAPFYAQAEINSFNRQHVLTVLGFVMGTDRLRAESFVIKTPVTCYHPRKLLRSSDLKPASIDVLIVDAEGMDAEIVLAFVTIPTFRPRAIVAEVDKAVPGLSMRLNTTLLDAGYITEMADSRNLFAWK